MEEKVLRDGSLRAAVLDYAKKTYQTEAEYPFQRDSVSAVLRHEDNRKWYGLVMEVEREKLGLSGTGIVCILNVKVEDSMFHDMLIQQDGYLPGYHMNKAAWLSILLDGTVPLADVCGMLDASYLATASKKKSRTR